MLIQLVDKKGILRDRLKCYKEERKDEKKFEYA